MSRFKFFEEETVKESFKESQFVLPLTTGKLIYKIDVFQKLIVNSRSFVNSETNIIWSLFVEEVSIGSIIVSIITKQNIVVNTTPNSKDLTDFSLIFNRPFERIQLKLSKYGSIEEVVNQKEILEKWQQLKRNELAAYYTDVNMKGLFIAGDAEFSSSLKVLQQNILYALFFNEIYAQAIENKNYKRNPVNISSKLFQGNMIALDRSQFITISDNKVILKDTFIQNQFEYLNLKKLYDKDYKAIIGAEFQYRHICDATAIYNPSSGHLEKVTATIEERANHSLFHTMQYNIELIK